MPRRASLTLLRHVVIHEIVQNEETAQCGSEGFACVTTPPAAPSPRLRVTEDVVHQTIHIVHAAEDNAVRAVRGIVVMLDLRHQDVSQRSRLVIAFAGLVACLLLLKTPTCLCGQVAVEPNFLLAAAHAGIIVPATTPSVFPTNSRFNNLCLEDSKTAFSAL